MGPRGAWGEGGAGFLPEASWKPAALRAPGASSAGVGPSMEPEAPGEGAPGRPVPPRLRGVPSLPGLEALLSACAGRESNYYVEKDLNPQHTPCLCPNPDRASPAGSHSGTLGPRLHMHTYIRNHTNSTAYTKVHTCIRPKVCVFSQHMYTHTTQHFNIHAFLGFYTLPLYQHTSRCRCVTAEPPKPTCLHA